MKIVITTALGADVLHMKPGTTYEELKHFISTGEIKWIEDRDGTSVQIRHIISMEEITD